MYTPNVFAGSLLQLKADLDEQLSHTNPSMRDFVRNAIGRRNSVVDLCNALSPYTDDYKGVPKTGVEGGQADVLSDVLVQHLRGTAWWIRQDPAVVRMFLARLKQADANHPFVKNWKVWAMDAIPATDTTCPSWPEIGQ